MSNSRCSIFEWPSNFIRIRFSSEGQSIFDILKVVLFIATFIRVVVQKVGWKKTG